jgi:hypothetical protein
MAHSCPRPKPGTISPDWSFLDRFPRPRDPDDLLVAIEGGRHKKMTRAEHAEYLEHLKHQQMIRIRDKREFQIKTSLRFATLACAVSVATCGWRWWHSYDDGWAWRALASYWGIPMLIVGCLLGFWASYRLLRKRGELV